MHVQTQSGMIASSKYIILMCVCDLVSVIRTFIDPKIDLANNAQQRESLLTWKCHNTSFGIDK